MFIVDRFLGLVNGSPELVKIFIDRIQQLFYYSFIKIIDTLLKNKLTSMPVYPVFIRLFLGKYRDDLNLLRDCLVTRYSPNSVFIRGVLFLLCFQVVLSTGYFIFAKCEILRYFFLANSCTKKPNLVLRLSRLLCHLLHKEIISQFTLALLSALDSYSFHF